MLRWVLQDSGAFPDLFGLDQLPAEQVVELGGGVDAATYLVRCPRRDVVVKLKSNGLEAEARALRAWQPYTPRVPEVLGSGTVPSAGERPTKYLILAALKNDEGRIVETAAEYLDRSPASARELGRALGAELHRLHQAVDETGFGNFADAASGPMTVGAATWRTSSRCTPTLSDTWASVRIGFRPRTRSFAPVRLLPRAASCMATCRSATSGYSATSRSPLGCLIPTH